MLTVYIHGTLPLALNKIAYFQPFFYCPIGLNLAKNIDQSFHHAQIGKTLYQVDPSRFSSEDFYLYGWSGKLSFKARKEAAQILYTTLNNFKSAINKKQPVRLITHSHGGNVALNLAYYYTHAENCSFTIEELILLACPVQKETQKFIESDLFKIIYSIHSHTDLMQIADPQGVYYLLKEQTKEKAPFFSRRHFQSSSKIINVKVSFTERPLLHFDFMTLKFFAKLPDLLDQLNAQITTTKNELFLRI